jgi:hypothetical protein
MLLYGSHDAPPTVVIQEPSATSLIVRCSLSNGHPTDGGSIAGLCLDGRFCEQLYMLLYRGSVSPPLPLSTSPASNGMLDSVQLYIWVLSLSAAAPAMADGVSILCWPQAALYTVLHSLRTIRQTGWTEGVPSAPALRSFTCGSTFAPQQQSDRVDCMSGIWECLYAQRCAGISVVL